MAHPVLALRKLLLATAGLGMTTYIQTFSLFFCRSFTNLSLWIEVREEWKEESCVEANAIIRSFLTLLQLSYRRSQLRIMKGKMVI